MAVSKRLRFEILRRDGFRCRYCGKEADDSALQVDHVLPMTLGGDDSPANLVAACVDCNAGKSSTPPEAETLVAVSDDAVRWADALRRAAEMQRAIHGPRRDALDAFDFEWSEWSLGGDGKTLVPRPDDWSISVGRFFDLGLNEAELRDAVRAAMAAKHVHSWDTFRYFCGICWKTIKERQELALQILENEEGCTCEVGPCEPCGTGMDRG